MNKSDIFVSFDTDHDGELFELLLAESRMPSAGFQVSGSSESAAGTDAWHTRMRERIRLADQIIVICGEHTGSSARVNAELCAAQEAGTPYFLLWGRRDIMCTKPIGAKHDDAMYSWTHQVLQDRLSEVARKARADAAAKVLRDAKRNA